ncbi:MAG: RagB/SusD family nutrient uptake outer membrane protein [Duncaniella sp.]|nr:RagB/SusD family nutrient uptake outer membrane protein [Duncaniella sp.]
MKLHINYLIAGVALSLSSCSDFVDIKTQGGIVPDKIENFRYILNNTSELYGASALPDIMSDDVYIKDGGLQYTSAANASEYDSWFTQAYTWAEQIYPESGYNNKDVGWNGMYNTIAYANVVINEIDNCTNGTVAERNALVAEAKVHRADAYLMLVNQYAASYDAATAYSDAGVPLVLTQDTEQSLVRASVGKVYDQIISDLKDAVPYLPDTQEFTTMPTKAAAYGELARAYLLMGMYKEAADNADASLKLNSNVVDLNDGFYPQLISSPEILLYKKPIQTNGTWGCTMLHLSDEIVDLLGEKDLRYQQWTASVTDYAANFAADGGRLYYFDINLGGRNVGPSVPEMMLIKAEYLARNGQAAEAMDQVNTLRKYRFAAADYEALTATDAEDALKQVIDERHREFFCRNLRWYDMRRLRNDSRFAKTYTRSWGGETLRLDPQSPRWLMPIPAYQVIITPGLEQNPR